ncbi:unnamed protein product, partial [Rotaria magnacalcarata]
GRENCLPDFLSRYSTESNDDLFEVENGLESKGNSTIPPSSQPAPSPSPRHDNKNSTILARMELRSRSNQHQNSQNTQTPNKEITIDNQLDIESDNQTLSTNLFTPKFSSNLFDSTKLSEEQHNDTTIRNIIENIRTYPNNFS